MRTTAGTSPSPPSLTGSLERVVSRASVTRVVLVVAFAALLLALPYLVSSFWLVTAIFAAISVSAAISLNLLVGYSGQVSVGHAFFVAAGAYTAAWGISHDWPIVVVVIVAAGLPAAVGLAVGAVVYRLRELYLAIATLGLVYIGQWLIDTLPDITGGVRGQHAPDIKIGSFDLGSSGSFAGIAYNRDSNYYDAALILALIFGLAVYNLGRTRTGRALMAIRDRQMAASTAGVNVARYKLIAFTVSSAMAGLVGMLYGAYLGYLVPDSFGLDLSIGYLAMIIAGGFGSVLGSVLGAVLISALPQLLVHYSDDVSLLSGHGVPQQLATLLYGAIIVGFLLFEPDGLDGIWRRASRRWRRKRPTRSEGLL